jgi:hypothetical protein
VADVFVGAGEAGRLTLTLGWGAIINLASGAGVAAAPYRNRVWGEQSGRRIAVAGDAGERMG